MRKALFLRTCDRDGRSYDGFQWPVNGVVRPEKWVPDRRCGGGLHGLLWGEGNSSTLSQNSSAVWIVFEANLDMAVDLDGEWKVPEATVVYYGEKHGATQYIYTHGGMSYAVHGITLTGGNHATLIGGDYSTLIGGRDSIIRGGHSSTLKGGNTSTLTGGDESTLIGGDYSTLKGGYSSTLTGGDYSIITGGDESTLTSEYGSRLTGGNRSIIIGGHGSIVAGGAKSVLMLRWWDRGAQKERVEVAYVGEDGIEPGVLYKLDEEHRFKGGERE